MNVELKAKDYTIRLPDNPAKKRIEEKYYEMTCDKIIFEPEMKNRLDYMRRLRQHYNMLINRTGVRVNPTTEQIEMPSSWWDDRIAVSSQNIYKIYTTRSVKLPNIYIFLKYIIGGWNN